MYRISNGIIQAEIASKGAELQSLVHLAHKLDYMWGGDPAFWGKKSPVLFPIVGGLKNNTYTYHGIDYTLPRHGFARDKEFSVTQQDDASITFTLTADKETLAVYPFAFRFSVIYSIHNHTLEISYQVENPGDLPLYFSVGAHPAFAVPLLNDTTFTDYYLRFNKAETSRKWPLSIDGLIKEIPEEFLHETTRLPLTKEMFYGDALVFKNLRSTAISILNDKNEHGLTVTYTDFPFMGIWSAKNADFVCIEPWCGIADNVVASGNIEHKEGINQLLPGESFKRNWSVEII